MGYGTLPTPQTPSDPQHGLQHSLRRTQHCLGSLSCPDPIVPEGAEPHGTSPPALGTRCFFSLCPKDVGDITSAVLCVAG